ncbi:MAG: hydrogenase-4 component G [Campylobacterota bacterium]|nr:hydrogenase-4 component G [Campylobacterota bacterium]
MQVNSTGYINANENALKNAMMHKDGEKLGKGETETTGELSVEEQINKSAVEVSISMNAQIVLFAMDSADQIKNNTDAQKNILSFLSGGNTADDFNLSNTGYEGKPITELSIEEATDLIGDDGFFGVAQTSQRVADFVFSFSGDDISILEKGREGIVKGFDEAQEMWGGELPDISYETQAKTLELIDSKIAELKANQEIPTQDTK